jgi:hypothetical protein
MVLTAGEELSWLVSNALIWKASPCSRDFASCTLWKSWTAPLLSKSDVTTAARELSRSGEHEDVTSTCRLKGSTCAGRMKNLHKMHPFCCLAENFSFEASARMPGLGLAGGGINIGYHRLWWTGSCLDLASPTQSRVLAAFTCRLSADAPCLC